MNHLIVALTIVTIVSVVVVGLTFMLRRDRGSTGTSGSGDVAKGGPATTLTCGDDTSKPTEQPEKAIG